MLAGLFIQIPVISAQELPAEESSALLNEDSLRLNQSEENIDLLRTAESALTLGEGSEADTFGTGMNTWAIVRMVLVLILAAAAVYGIVYLFKRASKPAQLNDPFLKILANAHLGSNRYVHVVSVGNKTWLLGASDGGVNLISEIEDTDVVNAMLLEDSKKTAQTPGKLPSFISMLKRMGASAQSNSPGVDEIRKRRERLKGL